MSGLANEIGRFVEAADGAPLELTGELPITHSARFIEDLTAFIRS
jgi:hypothetical protein